jgi:hypothetical protein
LESTTHEETKVGLRGKKMTEIYRDKLYPLGDRMMRLAAEIISQLGITEPKLLALALLSRTLANFKGVTVLTRERLVVEARVLTRCCYENMFMIGGLHAEGEEFADKMVGDEYAGRKNRARFSFENEGIFNALSAEVQEVLKDAVESFKDGPRFGYLNPKEASGASPFKEAYLAYSQFSGDAAHPTLTALRRHLTLDENRTACFDVIPDAKEEELDETLHLAFVALIGAMVAVNEMIGYTEAGKQLPPLNGELIALQVEKYGPRSLGEGMEIKTGES